MPEKCSIKVNGNSCDLPPAYVVSVASADGEYMLAVVCDEHREGLGHRLTVLQREGKVRAGTIRFDSVKTVVTDCVTGTNDDFVEIELSRGIGSDRKLT